jgi:cellulose biosynthesis protein BcsQ
MISERMGKDIEITTRILINDTQTDTHVDKHILTELKRRKIPVFNTTVGTRTIFKKARFRGTTPLRIEPSGVAAAEIMSLVQEILVLLGTEQEEMKIAS